MNGKIAIVGIPNVGKSSLFNELSGAYSVVANYPYTTIDIVRAHIEIGGKGYELIDLPGINSLATNSEDELIARDVLVKENPTVIIQCLDSANIERSLLLTSQLVELGIPLILALNFLDVAQKRGIWIDSGKLEHMLGIPAVEIITTESKGIKKFVETLEQVLEGSRKNQTKITYRNIIKDGLNRIRMCFREDPPSEAAMLLLLMRDRDIEDWVKQSSGDDVLQRIRDTVQELMRMIPQSLSGIIMMDRRYWVEEIIDNVIKRAKISTDNISEKIGRLTRHPLWGWPILAAVVYLTYLLVGKFAAGIVVAFLDKQIFQPLYHVIAENIGSQFLIEFLVGEYGILSTGLGNALATTLPILLVFFLILNIMEDTGYFINLCILVSRFTRVLGLSGQSILPLILGFGCKTMATLTTRILDSPKERYIAIFLTAFAIPCSPQMALIMGILGLLSPSAFFVVFGVLITVEFIAGVTLNRMIKDELPNDFVVEIPAIRFPNVNNLIIKLYHRMKWFIYEIPPLFMAGAFFLFVLDKTGGLLLIKAWLTPVVVTFLSLPVETVDMFLMCLVRLEAGAVLLFNLVEKNALNHVQIVVCLIIITTLGPCSANFMAIIKQLRLKRAIVMRVVILAASILTGGIVNMLYNVGKEVHF